jgi:hypothetical protein
VRRPKITVSADGQGLVSQAGTLLLAETLRASGLSRGLEAGLARWRSPRAVHDRGKILTDLVVALALGGDCLADVAVLRTQPEPAGPVASGPVISRLISTWPGTRPRRCGRSAKPGAGGAFQGEYRHPGGQFAGHGHQLAPDLVLVKAVQGEVSQAGGFGAPDPVLAAGATAVPQLEVSELPSPGVGGEAGDAVPVDAGEPQLDSGVGAFLVDDHPHPGRPGRQVQQAGELSDPGTRPHRPSAS